MLSFKRLLVASLATPLFLLGACTQGTPTLDEDPTTIPEGTLSPESGSGSEESPLTGQTTFGSSYEWANGLNVAISKPEKFQPSDAIANNADGREALSFTVTITNGTDEAFDPVMFKTSAKAGGAKADPILDSAKGFNGPPQTPIPAGKKVSFKIGYYVAAPTDITMDVQPDSGVTYEVALFRS